jgi:hypothetical protein
MFPTTLVTDAGEAEPQGDTLEVTISHPEGKGAGAVSYENFVLDDYIASNVTTDIDAYGIFNVSISSAVIFSSTSTGTPAFNIGSTQWPSGATVTITNNGYIQGKGGDGGAYDAGTPQDGEDGGTGLLFSSTLGASQTFVNNNRVSGGGGGGGGGGDSESRPTGFGNLTSRYYANGGGGAGFGSAGAAPTFRGAEDGTLSSGGKAVPGLESGDGGNRGSAGDSGDASSGGSAGAAVDRASSGGTYTNNANTDGSIIN